MKRALVLIALLVAGCGHPAAPQATAMAANGVAGKSLTGDLLGMVGPFAAKKALQAALLAALKKDAKTVQAWQEDVSRQPEAAQKAYLQQRIGLLQKALTAAEVAMMPLKDLDAAHEAVDAAKADDARHARLADKSPGALLAWGDELARDLDALRATF
jgi:hypothetical protein